MAETRARICDTDADRAAALDVRRVVFVEGQGVPEDLEVDGLDPVCTHFVAENLEGGRWRVVGAARLRSKGDRAKCERVAVLEAHRGQGLGVLLMAALEDEAREQGYGRVVLHAQVQVVEFYEKLGYKAEGLVFDEAGIDHRSMSKRL